MARKIIANTAAETATAEAAVATEAQATWNEKDLTLTRNVTVAAPKSWGTEAVELTVRISFAGVDMKQLCLWAMSSRVIALQAALRKHDINFVRSLAKKGVYAIDAADAGVVTDPNAAANALTKAFAGLSPEQQAALLAQLTAAAKK